MKTELTQEEASWISKRIDNAIKHYEWHDIGRVRNGREPEFISVVEKLKHLKRKLKHHEDRPVAA